MTMTDLDSEDILFDSLQTLYDYHPITFTTSANASTFVYRSNYSTHSGLLKPQREDASGSLVIRLDTPDTKPENWALHASSIWVSAVFLADHIDRLGLGDMYAAQAASSACSKPQLRVLELGASAGLPSIVISKLYGPEVVSVMATDYPDESLISALRHNIEQNQAPDSSPNCCGMPYGWGTNPESILEGTDGFDLIIAADTLWNPDLHSIFIGTLQKTLKPTLDARIHLVAGLHTGRYTIRSFIDVVTSSGFEMEEISENHATGDKTREWKADREGETEEDRRRWIVWMKLRRKRESQPRYSELLLAG